MELPDSLHHVKYGGIRIKGHRIDLYHVLECYNEGMSAEMIALEYPTLSLAVIHKTIAFYLENQVEVDTYLREVDEDVQRQLKAFDRNRTSPTLVELRRRFKKQHGKDLHEPAGAIPH